MLSRIPRASRGVILRLPNPGIIGVCGKPMDTHDARRIVSNYYKVAGRNKKHIAYSITALGSSCNVCIGYSAGGGALLLLARRSRRRQKSNRDAIITIGKPHQINKKLRTGPRSPTKMPVGLVRCMKVDIAIVDLLPLVIVHDTLNRLTT